MMFIGWFAALVSLLTALAMVKDTYLGASERKDMRSTCRRAWFAFRAHGIQGINRPELSSTIRLTLKVSMLVLIVASAGMCVLMPSPERQGSGEYATLLRVGLAVYMAMQAPCPWWRYIVHGQHRDGSNSIKGSGDHDVH